MRLMRISEQQWLVDCPDPAATHHLGRRLHECLPERCLVTLIGDLGAGKTQLVRALASAAGVDPRDVVSPTFGLQHTYQGQRRLHHLDAYRLGGSDEFLELGPEELFEDEAVTLIEWADRLESCLPPDRLEIRFEFTGPESRRMRLLSLGSFRWDKPLDATAE